jgi:hypothetical protein
VRYLVEFVVSKADSAEYLRQTLRSRPCYSLVTLEVMQVKVSCPEIASAGSGLIWSYIHTRERTARRLEVNAIIEFFQDSGFVGS